MSRSPDPGRVNSPVAFDTTQPSDRKTSTMKDGASTHDEGSGASDGPNHFQPATPTRRVPPSAPRPAAASTAPSRGLAERSWLTRLKLWYSTTSTSGGTTAAYDTPSLPTSSTGARPGTMISSDSSNRGSYPVRYDRFAKCSRSAYTTSASSPAAAAAATVAASRAWYVGRGIEGCADGSS